MLRQVSSRRSCNRDRNAIERQRASPAILDAIRRAVEAGRGLPGADQRPGDRDRRRRCDGLGTVRRSRRRQGQQLRIRSFRSRSGQRHLEDHEPDFLISNHRVSGSMTRNDWTRAEIAELFDLPFTELVFRAADVHRAPSRGGRGAALHLAVDQDRRLPGGLRLLLAVGACGHRPQGREADGRGRGDRRRARGEGAWLAALLHGRGVARAEGPRHARALPRWSAK